MERMPIPVVNDLNDEVDIPLDFRYITTREFEPVAAKDLRMTHDADPSCEQFFVTCCSCEDLCVKTATCECRQLTESSTVTKRTPAGWPEAG